MSINFTKYSLYSIVISGILVFVINGMITPFVSGEFSGRIEASTIFAVRQLLSLVTAVLLLIGSYGILNSLFINRQKLKLKTCLGFLFCIIGNMCLIGHEWGQIFLIHPIAKIEPNTLSELDSLTWLNFYR